MPNAARPWNIDLVARRLRACRKATGLSIVEIADQMAVTPQRWGQWERAARTPAIDEMSRFCDIYGASLDFIFRGVVSGMTEEFARKVTQSGAGAAKTGILKDA